MSATAHSDDIEITPALLERYDRPGPRYTSYPTAPEWRKDYGDQEYRAALDRASRVEDQPMSLYLHLPFCWERCLFCGCNVVISKRSEVADTYLEYLYREIHMGAEALGKRRKVMQMHWGGGTPTYLNVDQIRSLYRVTAEAFQLAPGAEIALEVDPRVTSREQLDCLRELGFNRISMGVQDLDAGVQAAINRNQSEEQTRQMFAWCKEIGFEGINIDLIYGLPGQSMASWQRTVESIIAIRPDRLAVYSYAHLPNMIKHQRKIDAIPRPNGPEKWDIFALGRRLFLEAGYRAIGMDHFALPTDELSKARDESRLHRNFMGYTVVPAADMIGFGVSAIGEIGGAYAQNEKRPVMYYGALDAGHFPTHVGIDLSPDDEIRRWLIRQLMCNFRLDFTELQQKFGVDYNDYFKVENQDLSAYIDEGFLERSPEGLRILPLGQAFVRNICMVFDAYLRKPEHFSQFSRTV